MKVLNDFYKIINTESIDNKHTVIVMLNQTHEIYKGHFPDNPVVPGVCLIQMIGELSSTISKTELHIKRASNIKFRSPVKPDICPELKFILDISLVENSLISVKCDIYQNETTCLSYKAEYSA
jgi:3-hydroxyacyl-[acyl-carrier-protein] dehydratase